MIELIIKVTEQRGNLTLEVTTTPERAFISDSGIGNIKKNIVPILDFLVKNNGDASKVFTVPNEGKIAAFAHPVIEEKAAEVTKQLEVPVFVDPGTETEKNIFVPGDGKETPAPTSFGVDVDINSVNTPPDVTKFVDSVHKGDDIKPTPEVEGSVTQATTATEDKTETPAEPATEGTVEILDDTVPTTPEVPVIK